MGLIDRRIKTSRNYNMAKEILDKLGITIRKYSIYLVPRGEIYEETYYEEYGLRIIKSGFYNHEKLLSIYYNGKKVLDKNTYIKGIWEDILEETYIRIPLILKQKKIEEVEPKGKNRIKKN